MKKKIRIALISTLFILCLGLAFSPSQARPPEDQLLGFATEGIYGDTCACPVPWWFWNCGCNFL